MMAENFAFAVPMTIIGILIVFAALVLLFLGTKFIRGLDDKLEAKKSAPAPQASVATPVVASGADVADKTQVIIAAAVAAYCKIQNSANNFIVLPERPRLGGAWAAQVRDQMQSSHVTKK